MIVSAILLALTCSTIASADEILVVDADNVWNLTLNDATGVSRLVDEPDVMVVKYADAITHFNLVDHAPLNASFTYTQPNPYIDLSIIFNASLSTGDVVNYTWNFADGNITTTTEPVITHFYAKPGVYNVNLTVTDGEGLTKSITKDIGVISIFGDIDCDGSVNMGDVILLLNYIGDPEKYGIGCFQVSF